MPYQTIGQTGVGQWASKVECMRSGADWTNDFRLSGDLALLGIPKLGSTVGDLRAAGVFDALGVLDPADGIPPAPDDAYMPVPWTPAQLAAIKTLRITYANPAPVVALTLTPEQFAAWDGTCKTADLDVPKLPSSGRATWVQYGDRLDVLYDLGYFNPAVQTKVRNYLDTVAWPAGWIDDPVYEARLRDRGLLTAV